MTQKTNRRDFLKTSALAGVGFWVSSRSARAQSNSPNEHVGYAAIGCGGMGDGDLNSIVGRGAKLVAMCDVDEDRAGGNFNRYKNVPKYKDFRKMLEKHAKEIDAVSVSTPDHTHAVASMMAMKMGKHVYTQKPLTHDVYEARRLTEEAKKLGVVTQMGNQGTSHAGFREAVEVVWSGAIGHVKEVHVWTNRPVWPQGTNAILRKEGVKYALHGEGSSAHPSVPSTLDWELWIGTSPMRPYQPGYQPFNWRGWWDWGTGALGDMACHTANMAFKACKLGYPTRIEAEQSEYNPETFPMWSVIRYDFPEREGLPPLKWTWYDGGGAKPAWVNKKLSELAHGEGIADSGSILVGEKGTLYSPNDYGSDYRLLPKGNFEGYKPPSPSLPRLPNGVDHYGEWLMAIKEGKPEICMSNFGYAGPFTETVLLGCCALRARKPLDWDGPNLVFTNIDRAESDQLVRREYRGEWKALQF